MTSPSIDYAPAADGTRIACTSFGSGPAVILPPSIVGSIERSLATPEENDFWAELSTEFTVVLYDRRGTGFSDRHPSQMGFAALTTDIIAIADHLGLERFDLVGTGPGAMEGIAVAAAVPQRVGHLVLVHAVLDIRRFRASTAAGAYIAAMEHDWNWGTEAMAQFVVGWGEPGGPALAEIIRATIPPEQFHAILSALESFGGTPTLERVQAPTLVLSPRGAYPVEWGQEAASRAPRGRLATLEGTALTVFRNPGAARTVIDFLQEGPERGERAPERLHGGLQTILFTDLESSAALTQRLGDEGAQELLRSHNAAVRSALEAGGGREIKHTGDGIMASFTSAISAVTAALRIQRDLAGGEIRVRIGVNAGEPIAEEHDLFGTAVILAARICDRAEPGQVLVSNVVRELCAGKQFAFAPVGQVTLKGFSEPVALFELTH